MKSFLKLILLLFIIIFSGAISVFLWFNRPCYPALQSGSSYEFEIKAGENTHTIAKKLYETGFIHSKEVFVAIVKLLRLDKNLKAGWIEIKPKFSTVDIIHSIYTGNFMTVSFTVPEGSTIADIKRILLANKIVSEKDLDDYFSNPNYLSELGFGGYKNAEGFLFPETYKFFKGVGTEKIFSGMVKLFFKKLEVIYPDYINLKKDDLYKKITMASIIEKEVKLPEEAPVISGIFYNRLNIGMKLQSCATIQFILQKPKEQLLDSDLLIDDPYNTYIYKGLPPSPICNPGITSLKAAFYPEKNDYLFFVVKDPEKGSHHFTKTYDEHLKAQAEYKKIKGFY